MRLGAVSFIHRFESSLNRDVHYHCCVIDGVFERADNGSGVCAHVDFRPGAELIPQSIATIRGKVRVRVLRWFTRSGLIDSDDVCEMLTWRNNRVSDNSGARERLGMAMSKIRVHSRSFAD